MTIRMCISILAVLCIAALATSAGSAAPASDPVAVRVQELFAQADELVAQRPQRSREYLASLPDEQLAKLYGKVLAAQYQSPTMSKRALSTDWTEKVAQDRVGVITELVTKYGAPLSDQQQKDSLAQYAKISDDLAALGPTAVRPILLSNKETYWMTRDPGRTVLVRQALAKMGPLAVESLVSILRDSNDVRLKDIAAPHLGALADARANDVLLHALTDESPIVRRSALQGLMKLGPNVVGADRLVGVLVERLEDEACLLDSIHGLGDYGDERAIEPLRVVQRFEVGRYKGDLRPLVGVAINQILSRAGKPVEKGDSESYANNPPSYDELVAAASCSNAAVCSIAIRALENHHDDRTARFFLERLRQEKKGPVLSQLLDSLGRITSVPQGNSYPGVSPSLMQEALDAIVSMAQANPLRDAGVQAAAVQAGHSVVFSAHSQKIELDHVDSYKAAIRQGMSSTHESVRVACYLACTRIATHPSEVDGGWTVEERAALVQELTPPLNSPNPHFRLMECMASIGDQRLAPRFIELLRHDDYVTRMFAAYALARVGGTQSLPALRRVAEMDPHQVENGVYDVRMAAQNAINQIEGTQPTDTIRKITVNETLN